MPPPSSSALPGVASSRDRERSGVARLSHVGLVFPLCAIAIAVAIAAGTQASSTAFAQSDSTPRVKAGVADDALFGAMASAEDRRAVERGEMAPLLRGLDAVNAPAVQVAAVRGLGRLERVELVADIARLFESPVPAVRVEVANALGQAAATGDARIALEPLRARAAVEQDADVRGALARSIGRLPYRFAADVAIAEEVMLALSSRGGASASAATATAAAAGATAIPGTADAMRESEPVTLFGVAHGFASLARKSTRVRPLSATALTRLRQLARYGATDDVASADASPTTSTRVRVSSTALGEVSPTATRAEAGSLVRRLALAALASAKDVDGALLQAAASDPDAQVRRQVLVTAVADGASALAETLALQARRDSSFTVRLEALRIIARLRTPSPAPAAAFVPTAAVSACEPDLDALDDANAHVVLLAIDQLAGCAHVPTVAERLASIADERPASARESAASPAPSSTAASASATSKTGASGRAQAAGTGDASWHRSAHALVSLARVAPERARAALPRVVQDPIWQPRVYAARAAGLLKERATLEALARDADDNVRNAAIEALEPLAGHDADDVYIAQLSRDDYQLVRTAARALAGTTRHAEAAPALLAALARITAQQRDTSRDARIALIDTLEKTGASIPDAARQLEPTLTDYDPVVAAHAAAALTVWRGRPHDARPRPLPPVPTPARQELTALRDTLAIVHMASGRRFTLTLFPLDAPTNVARFARQAKSGYFTNLTFHRVEPNFVIQGGSPHANEYWGGARFTRDEVGLRSHVRGTVGISTRGHDTGDGQLFVNLVDNYRLDHSYTIIGAVTDGLDTAVDAVLEGDAIARIELRPRAR